MSQSTVRMNTALRIFLDERGIRYGWVVEKLDITQSHFSRILAGDRPLTPAMARRLGELFEVPAETFEGGGS